MKEIKYVGKQVFDNKLEEGYAEIIIDIDNFLDEVDTDILKEYVEYHLDLIHPDDCECESVEDASDDDLVSELKSRSFDFLDEIDEDEMIEYLQRSGYVVDDVDMTLSSNLDYIDSSMLDEINNRFLNASVFERESMYKLLIR